MQSRTGTGGYPSWLLPILALGAIAVAAYFILSGYFGSSDQGTTGGGGGTTINLQQQPTGTGGGTGMGTGSNGNPTKTPVPAPNPTGGSGLQQEINTPGEYVNLGVSNTPQTGYGIGNLFVTTGPGSPTNLFPLGDVIGTSTPLSTSQQQTVLTNLENEPYVGWWDAPQSVAEASPAPTPAPVAVSAPAPRAHDYTAAYRPASDRTGTARPRPRPHPSQGSRPG